jgi:putative salt-induced outer membrane protein YdiY
VRADVLVSTLGIVLGWSGSVFAQTATPPTETGKPPADAAALVTLQAADKAPDASKAMDSTSATISAGGQSASGNAQLLAATANGAFDMRRGIQGFGAALLANYAEGAPEGQPVQRTTQNVQGRARYDLYFTQNGSGFLIFTGRNDYFQGLDFRLNIDPGVKYLFMDAPDNQLWAEVGYDYQYQINNNDARVLKDSGGKAVVLDDLPTLYVIDKTQSDHSARIFLGLKHAFTKEVTFSTGLEYLQSVVASTRYRVNYDALIAAKLSAGFSLGMGFTARYDHDPLPGKQDLDTTTTLSLIYGFSNLPAPPPPPCPCPAPAAAPPPPPASPPPPPSDAAPVAPAPAAQPPAPAAPAANP